MRVATANFPVLLCYDACEMSKGREVRHLDYVNQAVASALCVDIAGIEVAKEIAATVNDVTERAFL